MSQKKITKLPRLVFLRLHYNSTRLIFYAPVPWEVLDSLRCCANLNIGSPIVRGMVHNRGVTRTYINRFRDHPAQKLIKTNKARNMKKIKAMKYYGGLRCVKCGITDFDVLCFDHINNDGHIDREFEGKKYNVVNVVSKRNYPEGFQILCYNCNNKKERMRKRMIMKKRYAQLISQQRQTKYPINLPVPISSFTTPPTRHFDKYAQPRFREFWARIEYKQPEPVWKMNTQGFKSMFTRLDPAPTKYPINQSFRKKVQKWKKSLRGRYGREEEERRRWGGLNTGHNRKEFYAFRCLFKAQ